MNFNMWMMLIIVVFALIFIIKELRILGNKRAAKKAKAEREKYKEQEFGRKVIRKALFICDSMAPKGLNESSSKWYDWDFRIKRRGKVIKSMQRTLTPREVLGGLRIIRLILLGLGLIFLLVRMGYISVICFTVALILPIALGSLFDSALSREDEEIEKDFLDLYLILYSRLKDGVNAKMAPALEEYLAIMDSTYGEVGHDAIRNFARDLRSYIAIYSDECVALDKIKNVYRGAVVINFCNIAQQAIRGIDNGSKLEGFKQELFNKEIVAIEREYDKRIEKGKTIINAIYIIIFQFLILLCCGMVDLDDIKGLLG